MEEGALGLVVGGERWVLRLRFRCITQPRHEVWLYNSVILSMLARKEGLSWLEEGGVFSETFCKVFLFVVLSIV